MALSWHQSVYGKHLVSLSVDLFSVSLHVVILNSFTSVLFLFGALFSILSICDRFVNLPSVTHTPRKLELREQEKLLGEDGEAYDHQFDGYNRPEDTVAFSTILQPLCPTCMLSAPFACLLYLVWFCGGITP